MAELITNEQIRSEVNEVLDAANHGMSRETLLEKYKEIAGVAISESLFNECLRDAIEFQYGEDVLKELVQSADNDYENTLNQIEGKEVGPSTMSENERTSLTELFKGLV